MSFQLYAFRLRSATKINSHTPQRHALDNPKPELRLLSFDAEDGALRAQFSPSASPEPGQLTDCGMHSLAHDLAAAQAHFVDPVWLPSSRRRWVAEK
jgi:hypothetical protein